jgi:hypothetical protein
MARLQVRHDDVHDAEDNACGEQDEFDGHARQYTFSRVHVADGSIASVRRPARYFRSTPINGHRKIGPTGPFRANIGSTGRDIKHRRAHFGREFEEPIALPNGRDAPMT